MDFGFFQSLTCCSDTSQLQEQEGTNKSSSVEDSETWLRLVGSLKSALFPLCYPVFSPRVFTSVIVQGQGSVSLLVSRAKTSRGVVPSSCPFCPGNNWPSTLCSGLGCFLSWIRILGSGSQTYSPGQIERCHQIFVKKTVFNRKNNKNNFALFR
jgi:hypothetical protein